MRIIKPSFTVENFPTDLLTSIEKAGRTAYKSEDKITSDSAAKFVKSVIKRGHESVLEHSFISVRFVIDRGVSHELVRHRLCAFTQESTRFVSYAKGKFGSDIAFIKPCFFEDSSIEMDMWVTGCQQSEQIYLKYISMGRKPEEARSVLNNSLKTEILVSANVREWRHIFKLRTAPAAHPQMREIMDQVFAEFVRREPILFEDLLIKSLM